MPSTAIDRIDGISTSEAVKAPVRAGTLGNITLSGLQTIDGVVLVANDRVLVKNQTNQVNNGIYTAQVLTWIREPDFDGARDAVQGTIVQVYAGTTQALTWWNVSTANPIVIGSSSITFVPTYAGFNPIAQATETALGIAEIATQAETDAGTDDLRFVTPKKNATNMQLQKYFWVGTLGGTANALTCTLTPNPGAYTAGLRIIGIASADNSGAATLNSNALGVKNITKSGAMALSAGDIKSGQIIEFNYDGTRLQLANPAILIQTPSLGTGFITGLNFSNDISLPNTVLDISAGSARDATDVDNMILATAYTKTTGAWAVGSGNGSLDTGTIGVNSNYNVWLIKRTDTGVVEILSSLSATAPTMPASYTEKRLLDGFCTDGSANILSGKWKGTGNVREFEFDSPPQNGGWDNVNPGTSAQIQAVRVPGGRKVKAKLNVGGFTVTSGVIDVYVSDPDNSDLAPQPNGTAAATTPGATIGAGSAANSWVWAKIDVWTNTSGQIRYRSSVSQAANRAAGFSLGWLLYL